MVDITMIGCLHGHYPELPGGDLLIVTGDLTARDEPEEYGRFCAWIQHQKYKKKLLIGGNHDNFLQLIPDFFKVTGYCDYLCDSGTEFEYEECYSPNDSKTGITMDVLCYRKKTLKIWGSPWTKTFEGMNPHCKAFTVDTEEELAEKWAKIPDDIDILVTHGPPMSVLDWNVYGDNCGSKSLFYKANSLKNLKLFVFSHIHEAYGMYKPGDFIKFEQDNKKHFGPARCKSMPYIVNCSHMNEKYQPLNKPIRIEL